jgi:hypothetical protein
MGWQQEHACKRAACCVVDLDARDVHVHVSCTHVFMFAFREKTASRIACSRLRRRSDLATKGLPPRRSVHPAAAGGGRLAADGGGGVSPRVFFLFFWPVLSPVAIYA